MWIGFAVLLVAAIGAVVAFPGAAIVRHEEVKTLQEFRHEKQPDEVAKMEDPDSGTLVP
jgi:hypothetical protein